MLKFQYRLIVFPNEFDKLESEMIFDNEFLLKTSRFVFKMIFTPIRYFH